MEMIKPAEEGLLRRLFWPEGRVDAVLDTDTFNEIDMKLRR